MSINLIKEREEKVKICLKKKFKPETNIIAKVNLILDVSGSMHNRYISGKMQDVVERIYPLASVFDDDKELDMYIFNYNYSRLEPVKLDNYEGYVKSKIVDTGYVKGGTSYSPVIEAILNQHKNTTIPVFNIFITDGDNTDKHETEIILKQSSNQKIFWQFIGIGSEEFDFLKKLDNMSGRINDNADFFNVNDLSNMSDEELYNDLLNEFPSFLENFKEEKINNNGLLNRLFRR
jgi:predicted metal-dependent peptidase